ncbi:MAG: hypothetical protein KCHDKBKB_00489 [Elusimicrobia bacterium]|nr:hypothetical protein [Elusimicrobiota bacterium]
MEYLVDSPLDCFIALAEFKGPLRELIHAFKYRGKGYLARELSQRLVSTLQDSGVSWDCLVPVPMSSWKELKRGYNPPFLVAREMASQLKSAFYPNFLVRNFFSRSQTKMGRKERFHNAVKGFKLKRRDKVLSGQSVLLVDDVSTTGATLVVCARLLKSLGAIRVGGIVIAKDVLDI